MRFNGKSYSDDQKKAAIDRLWHDGMNQYHLARQFFDTATPGVGWIIDTRCGEGDTSLAQEYAERDAVALGMMVSMLNPLPSTSAQGLALRIRADAVLPDEFPESQTEIRKLARVFRSASRAFWRYVLTNS